MLEIVETTENERKFQEAWDAFVPAPDDHPDRVPLCRNWDATQAVVGKEIMRAYHHHFHEVICMETRSDRASTWRIVLNGLRQQSREESRLVPPRFFYPWYLTEPDGRSETLEKRAKAFFESAFKQKYPDKRLNSKFANAEWEKLHEKMFKLAFKDYQDQHQEYSKKLNTHKEREAQEFAAWVDKLHVLALFDNFVFDLKE